jgi:hypothetical protein
MSVSQMRRVSVALVAGCFALLALGRPAPALAATGFTSSAISSPASGSQLFYDSDSGEGSLPVQGSVSPALTTVGTLLCYSAPETYTVAAAVPIVQGAFNANVSLAPVAGQVCRLEMVPLGASLSGDESSTFSGPVIIVSEQQTFAANGNTFGYNILAGDLDWSFAFDSLGACPITVSDSTDPNTFGSYSLFYGNACLPALSGLPGALDSRSSIQIDGTDAYPPGALPFQTGKGGYAPITYAANWDANHDTVQIGESDPLLTCAAPGSFPPLGSGCPALTQSGIQVQQNTSLLAGGQVARVTQTFTDTDNTAHKLDLLVGQSIHAYSSGGTPGIEFPGQSAFASHATPDVYTQFPAGPGSIDVIADLSSSPGIENPIGAITYSTPPEDADFINLRPGQTQTFVMHYVENLPPGGSVTLQWSFSQATSASALAPLVQLEVDRFYTPVLTVASPPNGMATTAPSMTVAGQATDPEGITSVTIDDRSATVGPGGAFSTVVPLAVGPNTIQIAATNLAGVTATTQRVVTYTPAPCIVPRLNGRSLTSARSALAASGCTMGPVLRVHSRRVRRGRVVRTTPGAGTHRTHGAAVRITVSAGAPRSRAPRGRHRSRSGSTRRGRSGRS